MHLLVTGGRSDLCRSTVEFLLADGHRVSWVGPSIRMPAAGRFHQVMHREAPWRDVDFRGLDGLLHLAGPHPSAHLAEADLHRVAAFDRDLLRRTADAGVDRVAMISVVSNPRVQELPFVRMKRTTEDLLRESGLPATVFRVPWLYGPRDDFLTRLWRWVRHRSLLLVPGLENAPVQLCREATLAAAMVRAVERSPGRLRVYEAATTTPIALGELIRQLGRIVRGAPPRTIHVARDSAYRLRGPLKLVGLMPVRSPMWALLEGGLTCATTAWERDFDLRVQPPVEALVQFVRAMGSPTLPWWGRSVAVPRRADPQ